MHVSIKIYICIKFSSTFLSPHRRKWCYSQLVTCSQVHDSNLRLGLEYEGIAENLHHAIQKCNEEFRSELYSNVILSGGNTLFPGLQERLQKELQHIAPAKEKVNNTIR